ncbi:MAG: hypothetical protein M3P49_06525 [Actinomycetota bacterium]|nr:hypothetical protein [Actinomycetota bacterium]
MDTVNETIAAAPKAGDASAGKKKPRRRERDRIEYSRYRDDALEFAYRFGGYTARQLSELLELRYPELEAKTEAKVSPALRASYRAIESMKRSRLFKKVAVRRGHLAGADGRVTPEDFAYLSPAEGGRAAVWAGSLCGVEKARDAREGYRRHQLPGRPEHASWRTDLILLLLWEACAAGVAAPLEEAFGESFPGYPYWIAKPALDKAGAPLPTRKNARAYHDPAIPDASMVLYDVRFDLEVERWTRTGAVGVRGKKGVVGKVERHASHWLGLLERAGGAASPGGWPGMPEEVAPLVIVMREHARAVSMRNRVGKAIIEGRLPRHAELARRMGRHRLRLGRLVLFVGWDRLVRDGPLDAGHSALSSYGEGGGGLDDVPLDEAAAYVEHCREPGEEA